ncbi:hypothetical protein GOODEAATRI_025039 [Goodea atripinnis]|uniref:Uncharacterized protein n=1 Tax=Goodea atripinnis TaxID=208336 RepID=A0ABV0PRG4_9TELE
MPLHLANESLKKTEDSEPVPNRNHRLLFLIVSVQGSLHLKRNLRTLEKLNLNGLKRLLCRYNSFKSNSMGLLKYHKLQFFLLMFFVKVRKMVLHRITASQPFPCLFPLITLKQY